MTLGVANGLMYQAIQSSLQNTAPTLSRQKQRFEQSGIEGLGAATQGSKPRSATPALQAESRWKVQQKLQGGSSELLRHKQRTDIEGGCMLGGSG